MPPKRIVVWRQTSFVSSKESESGDGALFAFRAYVFGGDARLVLDVDDLTGGLFMQYSLSFLSLVFNMCFFVLGYFVVYREITHLRCRDGQAGQQREADQQTETENTRLDEVHPVVCVCTSC